MSSLLLQTPGRILKTFLGPCALLSVVVIVGKVSKGFKLCGSAWLNIYLV